MKRKFKRLYNTSMNNYQFPKESKENKFWLIVSMFALTGIIILAVFILINFWNGVLEILRHLK